MRPDPPAAALDITTCSPVRAGGVGLGRGVGACGWERDPLEPIGAEYRSKGRVMAGPDQMTVIEAASWTVIVLVARYIELHFRATVSPLLCGGGHRDKVMFFYFGDRVLQI